MLAIGTSPPGTGRPPELVARAYSGGQFSHVVVRSGSPVPVKVSVSDGFGQPMRYWRALYRGQKLTDSLVTGRSYRYCFSQSDGSGYASTRGCGRLVIHQYLNGVKVPDGGAVLVIFGFVGL